MSSVAEIEDIPSNLLNIKNPPKRLYYKGKLELLQQKKVAIVGSRLPNQYTKKAVTELASKLSQAGLCVVSGGALGVDIIAHQAAIPHTIAVFANSLDIIYPIQNRKVIERIYTEGLALSEHREQKSPNRYDFVLRNRIVTGISDVVVIAQADLNSGSIRSAEHAIRQGKEIFVLPHRLGESEGTHLLALNKVAKNIESIDSFLEYLGVNRTQKSSNELKKLDGMSYEEAYRALKERVFELELKGEISIVDGVVRVSE